VFLFFFKQFRPIIYIGIFIGFIYLLVLNSACWVLPFSELLYPERVVYFMIVAWTFIFGYFLTGFEYTRDKWSVFKGKLKAYSIIAIVLVGISLVEITGRSIGLCKRGQINCNRPTIAAFDWINAHTEKEAVLVASYADAGMWIPTFTNRATLGTHLHFIHVVMHIPDSLNASTAPRYFFITKRDVATKAEIVNSVNGRSRVFANEEVEIYH
jgi:hypothetical protein